jgi:hypothetical protein
MQSKTKEKYKKQRNNKLEIIFVVENSPLNFILSKKTKFNEFESAVLSFVFQLLLHDLYSLINRNRLLCFMLNNENKLTKVNF